MRWIRREALPTRGAGRAPLWIGRWPSRLGGLLSEIGRAGRSCCGTVLPFGSPDAGDAMGASSLFGSPDAGAGAGAGAGFITID